VIGSYGALEGLMGRPEERIDQVIVALDREEADQHEKVLVELADESVNVILVPDLSDAMTQHSAVENLDGLPVINLRATPLVGWAAVGKRSFDIAAGGLLLLASAPLMLLISAGIALTSGLPVLFIQERMGLDGRVFRMLKFRSMIQGAERESGPVWTDPDDARRTRLGALLRRTNLDELPQLWNVLRGDMSLVGPRPERPVFIEGFRSQIPRYMQRHEVKAGMTGWAQVHGWRGRSSIHERLEHDLYYIRNWSFGLDVRILLMTLWRGSRSPNAY
jgi:exopolysaccharide biosynthesis polyprenyl glycosylphosphotransferase